ncbi:GBS Bsp-like repeat-containing protein [Streptococcus salivarius]|jgi:cell wall hydrolase/autolysin|uniref:GBS Bsp-like repeat-containing protein n=1 Tax=Streptococcus salivarius TaxID=1304 RepID=A0AB35IWC0_STRSL|nr:GBS Bsp-like repeat-containing protein [Streptococcus salivarius]MCB7035681.1 GBS Bsp-like repeat-containing protein [Streptococcus salivarius]MDB8604290.1 GBS Bsp-like repeat-containing protein [Streptococcus salivarius]MDB8606231.1 GBS Bsp-like repeat-containing protein [Streptococcus salivarius]MDB8608193.1 GBS Bsp-like repeat-containing protein [Streptococcus salivarius]
MRTKDFIYYASAAVLLAVTTQVAHADEVATQTPSVTEGNQYQPATAAEIFGGEAALPATPSSTVSAPVATSEVAKPSAPAVSTSLAPQSSEAVTTAASTSVANSTVAVTSTSVTSSVVSSESATASTSATSSETSNSALATPAKLTNSTDVPSPTLKVQPKTFIDVSSHNGEISVDDYRVLARQGVGGVVVKLTEDTWYNNPKAPSQVRNAQIAGLQVSTYHFSRYTTEEEARAEARFYIQAAQKLNLPKNTVMVNDFEDSKMLPNINRNTQAWVNEMRKHGYNNLMFYTSASWLDENNLGYRGPVSTSQFGIENFWVAQYPSTTLTATSAKNMRYNTKTGAWQFSATANLLPGKHVFDHSVDYTGRFTANASAEVDATQGDLSGTISIVNNNPTVGSFDVVISNVKAPNGVETVSVPIWSEINGQDDIIWYTADRQNNGTYTVNVKASAHKNSTGLYNIHLYYIQKDGQMTGVGGTTTQVFIGKTPEQLKPKASFAIENNNAKAGTFDAVITNISAPLGVKEVLVPSWSLENGQDDLIWHKATKQADGSYRVTIKASEHKGNKGNYRADAYIVDNSNNRHYIAEKVVSVYYARPSGVLTIENNNTAAGTFDAVVRNIVAPTGLKEVLVPSWSLAGGQDDLIWHKATRQADGSYRVTIKATDHKNSTGKYRADAYIVDDSNKRFYLTEKVVEVTQTRPSASLFIENNNADLGTFDAVIRNIVAPNGVKEVLVPSWSLVNGQDDLVWHKASRQSDGSYRVTIKASDHKNSLGNYRADVYIVDNANQRHYVTETIVDVKHNKPVGTISVVNNNKDTGTFDVIISDVYSSKGVRTVQVPIWSEKDGQDDIIWYEATRQANGTYTVNVQATNHKNSTGLYNIHLYYILNDGSQVGVGGTTTTVEFRNAKTKTQTYITNVNSEAGSYTVVVDQAPQGRQIKNIRVAVWSESNQGNLSWYNTAPTGSHTEINVSTVNHKNLIGNYTTHVYVDYVDNTEDGFNLGETALAPRNRRVEPQTTYYSQRDPRWASKWYGVSNMDQSGCVPTSLAMTFTDILGTVIAPTTVADYLYYNTNSFNKTSVAGTDADGIVLASKNWGLKSNMLSSISNIASALMSGQHVLAAVGASQFINYPYTHEIVLHGYDNGKTYVRDPFNANNNGWYSLDYIHGVQSRDAMDTKLGAPFFSIFA